MNEDRDIKRGRVAGDQIDHVGVPLWQASSAFQRKMIDAVRTAGFEDISIADSEILPFLDIAGATLTDIASRKGISRQAVHQSVHSLVRRGYVELVAHPEDARARVVLHTDEGLRLLKTLQGIKSRMHQDALQALGPGKLKALSQSLEALTKLYDED